MLCHTLEFTRVLFFLVWNSCSLLSSRKSAKAPHGGSGGQHLSHSLVNKPRSWNWLYETENHILKVAVDLILTSCVSNSVWIKGKEQWIHIHQQCFIVNLQLNPHGCEQNTDWCHVVPWRMQHWLYMWENVWPQRPQCIIMKAQFWHQCVLCVCRCVYVYTVYKGSSWSL